MKPSVGKIVHYVAPGSADGRYPRAHRAAIVTEICDPDPMESPPVERVNLAVMNPTGIHFAQAVPYDESCGAFTWHQADQEDNHG